jgi:hypothetical protein
VISAPIPARETSGRVAAKKVTYILRMIVMSMSPMK